MRKRLGSEPAPPDVGAIGIRTGLKKRHWAHSAMAHACSAIGCVNARPRMTLALIDCWLPQIMPVTLFFNLRTTPAVAELI